MSESTDVLPEFEGMIIVSDAKIMHVDRNPAEILQTVRQEHDYVMPSQGEAPISAKDFRELIRGRRFRRPDGSTLVVGLDRSLQDLIGIHFEAYDELQGRIESIGRKWQSEFSKHKVTKQKLEEAEDTIDTISNFTFIDRLIWAFSYWMDK